MYFAGTNCCNCERLLFLAGYKFLQLYCHEVPVVGETMVHLSYGDQEAFLPVIVTAGDVVQHLRKEAGCVLLVWTRSRLNRFVWKWSTMLRN